MDAHLDHQTASKADDWRPATTYRANGAAGIDALIPERNFAVLSLRSRFIIAGERKPCETSRFC
jgi:hypothetical protein